MSPDNANHSPANLTAAAALPRSAAPNNNSCSCSGCAVASPHTPQTTTPPKPIPPVSTTHPSRSNHIHRAPWCRDSQTGLLDTWPGHPNWSISPGPLKSLTKQLDTERTPPPQGTRGWTQEPPPRGACMGSWGPLTKLGWNHSSPPPPVPSTCPSW